MRTFLTAIVLGVALMVAPMRAARADYDPGWFSVYVIPFLTLLEGAVVGIIANLSTVMTQLSIQGTSVQNTLQTEKILATVVEVAKGKEVAAAQAQLQQDAARIRELTRLPPMACKTLDGVKNDTVANEGVTLALKDVSESMEKHTLGSQNPAAIASGLLSSIERLKKDVQPSAAALLGPKVYSTSQDEAAQVFMKTVMDPAPFESLPSAWVSTPQGRAYELQRLLYQQKLSAGGFSLEQAYAVRRPVPEAATKAAAKKG